MRLARPVGNLLLAAGIAALGWCALVVVRAHRVEQQADRYLAAASEARREGVRLRAAPPAGGEVIGRIDIPRVGVSAIVLEGTGAGTLRLGAGHIPGTALPGDNGNAAIAGHRDTVFRGLRGIRKNDEIVVTTLRGSYAYRVESARVVSPDDVSVLGRTAEPVLTLVTCYPFHYIGPAPERFVVRARRIAG